MNKLKNSKNSFSVCTIGYIVRLTADTVLNVLRKTARVFLRLRTAKNILIIAPRCPEYDRASGDLRLFNLLTMLSGRYTVTLYDGGTWRRKENELLLKYIDVLKEKNINVLLSYDELEKFTKQYYIDFVVAEFYFMAMKYNSFMATRCRWSVRIIDSVDVHYVREAMMAKVTGDSELAKISANTRTNELQYYRKCDYVWSVSEFDTEVLVSEGIDPNKILLIPNIHMVDDCAPGLESRNMNTLLFIGGFLHQPNGDAIDYFCTQIWPLIIKEVPTCQLIIAGDSPPENIRNMASEKISVLGYVPDTKPLLDAATVSIAPLRFGAGLKGKVGEALANGLPLVTTSVGAQGMQLISGEHCFIADTPEEFALSVIRLLQDQAVWNKFSKNGCMFMHEHFGYEKVKNKLYAFFDSL